MEKRNKKKIGSIVLILAGTFVLAYLAHRSINEMRRGWRIEKEISALKEEAKNIENKNEILQEKIAYFETQEYKEKIAKERLNLQKEGEKVVVIRPSSAIDISNEENGDELTRENAADIGKEDGEEPANYIKWWNIFLKNK